MTQMNITKIAEDRYHVECREPFVHEEVDGTQFLGMASGRTSPMPALEIVRLLGSQFVGYTVTVEYSDAD